MSLSYFLARTTLPNGCISGRRFLACLLLAGLIPVSVAQAQPSSSSSDEFRETLVNAERAIMEGLSAQAIGASPAAIPVKASLSGPTSDAPRVSQPVQPPKQAPKPAVLPKKAPAQPITAKVQRPPEAPKAPSEAEIKAASLARENESLRKQLSVLQDQVQKLESDLQESRSQLTVAETEASRLATMVDAKTRASLGRYNVPMPPAPKPQREVAAPKPVPAVAKPVEDVKPPSRGSDMQIATVTVDKADLRVGPGKENSALMSLRRGSRLAVEERQGEWYRVFAPNGQRAWVHSSLVSFGDGASSMNDGSAVRVKGYSSNSEEEAFRRLQKISSGK